jgi:uncharacterized membrane protein YcaP (DUF421 family)
MFTEQIPIAEKVLRTIIVYALIAVLFRITGKRGLANLNTFDFIVIFLLSNVVQNAVIGNDQSLLGGMIGAVTLVLVNTAVDRLIAASALAARIFEGRSTVVIEAGKILTAPVRRLGLRATDLEHAVRLQNAEQISQIQVGRLDSSGQLLLELRPAEQGATKADIAAVLERLGRIERALGASPAAPR